MQSSGIIGSQRPAPRADVEAAWKRRRLADGSSFYNPMQPAPINEARPVIPVHQAAVRPATLVLPARPAYPAGSSHAPTSPHLLRAQAHPVQQQQQQHHNHHHKQLQQQLPSTVSAVAAASVLLSPAAASAAEAALRRRLHAWRSERAQQFGTHWRTELPDVALNAIVRTMPTNAAQLAALPGLSPVRWLSVSPAVLVMLEQHRRWRVLPAPPLQHQRQQPPPPLPPPQQQQPVCNPAFHQPSIQAHGQLQPSVHAAPLSSIHMSQALLQSLTQPARKGRTAGQESGGRMNLPSFMALVAEMLQPGAGIPASPAAAADTPAASAAVPAAASAAYGRPAQQGQSGSSEAPARGATPMGSKRQQPEPAAAALPTSSRLPGRAHSAGAAAAKAAAASSAAGAAPQRGQSARAARRGGRTPASAAAVGDAASLVPATAPRCGVQLAHALPPADLQRLSDAQLKVLVIEAGHTQCTAALSQPQLRQLTQALQQAWEVERIISCKQLAASPIKTALAVLRLMRGWTPAAAKASYRRLCLAVHPDKCSAPHAVAAFQMCTQALAALAVE